MERLKWVTFYRAYRKSDEFFVLPSHQYNEVVTGLMAHMLVALIIALYITFVEINDLAYDKLYFFTF